MKRLFPILLAAIGLLLILPWELHAQVQVGWPDATRLFAAPSSQPQQPILDFATDGGNSPIQTVAYEEFSQAPLEVPSDLTLIGEPIEDVMEFHSGRQRIPQAVYERPLSDYIDSSPYELTLLPDGPIYKTYMAGVKESRLAVHLIDIVDDNWMLDGTLGGRFGVLRFGRDSASGFLAEGIQWDIEGSAQVRLDIPEDVDVRAVDFRAGTFFSWSYAANPAHRSRFGYYHLSSHLGDEFLLKNPTYPRLNFAHDLFFFGHSYYVTPRFRLYGEVGWAFYHLIADTWEFQFGAEWAPVRATGPWGEPFVAVGCHLREEVNFGGSLVAQAGWAWVGEVPGRTLRMGLHYHNGESTQNSFYDDFEHQIGFGIWYDF